MTIYSIKINKHETAKTTEIHEAKAIAKKVLIDKLKDRCNDTNFLYGVHEKMYVYNGETQIRFYATIGYHGGGMKTYSTTIKCLPVANGGYDFDLHKEIVNGFKGVKQ